MRPSVKRPVRRATGSITRQTTGIDAHETAARKRARGPQERTAHEPSGPSDLLSRLGFSITTVRCLSAYVVTARAVFASSFERLGGDDAHGDVTA